MREGWLEVTVCDATSKLPLEEVRLDDKVYCVVTPGTEYFVRVAIHRNGTKSSWPFQYLRVGLVIDGRDVNYWKRLDFTEKSMESIHAASAVFSGFQTGPSSITTFKFGNPSSPNSASPSATASSSASVSLAATSSDSSNYSNGESGSEAAGKVGLIQVVLFEANVETGTFSNVASANLSKLQSNGPTTKEASPKFWKNPSAVTTPGRTSVESFRPMVRWSNKTTQPLKEVVVHYHTKQMITTLMSIHSLGADGAEQPSAKRRRRENGANDEVVDLTREQEGNEDTRAESGETSLLLEEEEVMLVEVEKPPIPLIDISSDVENEN